MPHVSLSHVLWRFVSSAYPKPYLLQRIFALAPRPMEVCPHSIFSYSLYTPGFGDVAIGIDYAIVGSKAERRKNGPHVRPIQPELNRGYFFVVCSDFL